MKIPSSPQGGAPPPFLPAIKPSTLLMAAAEMHDKGRLVKSGAKPKLNPDPTEGPL